MRRVLYLILSLILSTQVLIAQEPDYTKDKNEKVLIEHLEKKMRAEGCNVIINTIVTSPIDVDGRISYDTLVCGIYGAMYQIFNNQEMLYYDVIFESSTVLERGSNGDYKVNVDEVFKNIKILAKMRIYKERRI